MHNLETGKKSSDLDFVTGLNEEQVLDMLGGDLTDLQRAAVARVVKSRQKGLMAQIEEESHRLECEEAENHLLRWINVHWEEPQMKNLLRQFDLASRPDLASGCMSEIAERIAKHKRKILMRVLHKKEWADELAVLEGAITLLEEKFSDEGMVEACQEIDHRWRSEAMSDGVLDGYIVRPTSYQSVLEWCRVAFKNQWLIDGQIRK